VRKICHPAHLRATAHFGAQALEIVENAGLPTESANSRVGGVSFWFQRLCIIFWYWNKFSI